MSRRVKVTEVEEPYEEKIIDIDVSQEMQDSFLEYAYSVIYSRALPDARDGMKPVQRRIIYQMADMGLRPDKGHVKSSRVVGDVMGKLHPHGDTAIYDALVRLAQPFALRVPLVDGHGNFGSLDDGPAAPRYTEARLSAAALLLTDSLDEDTVNFVPNYDNQLTQPEVLPAAFPNLLVNGASGIAVGMATNMAPHNLVEVISAARHLIKKPDATLEDIMKFVPGPDLPTGGVVVGLDGIRDAYRTGRGSFRIRAAARIENVTARKKGIVITELPYTVGPEKILEKIKDAVQSKKLTGITDAVDLTDRENGMRVVIEVKNGFHPEAVLEQLYKLTPMEDSFGINNVALVDGQPRTLGLLELLRVYVDHRIDVVRRRTNHRLLKRTDRLHLVAGLLIAIVDIDEVIEIIRSSEDVDTARQRLISVFDLSEIQAEYILELRLRRLTKFSQVELEKERDALDAEILALQEILGNESVLRKLVSDELGEVAAKHGTPRRTVLLESAAAGAIAATAKPLEVADDPCLVMLSATGLLARAPLPSAEEIAVSGEGAGDIHAADDAQRSAHDVLVGAVRASARGYVGLVTSSGRLHKLSVLDLPAMPPVTGAPSLSGGHPVTEFVSLDANEVPLTLVSLAADAAPIALGTAEGSVKRVIVDHPNNRDEWEIIGLKDGDRVVGAGHAADDAELVFLTSDAQLLHFPASAVRPQGRPAGGMAGIKLSAGASVLFFGVLNDLEEGTPQSPQVVTISGDDAGLPGTQAGSYKCTPFSEYPGKGRATGGVRAHRFLKGETTLLIGWVGAGPVKATGATGQPIELPAVVGKRDGSGAPLSKPIFAIG